MKKIFFTNNLPLAEVNGLMYVVGWTCKKILKTHNCEICRTHLLDSKRDLDLTKTFCYFKTEENSESPFGGLTIPSDSCLQYFKEIESIVRCNIDKVMLGSKISQNLISRLNKHKFKTPLQLCSTQLVSTIHLIYVRLKIFYTLKWRNREPLQRSQKKNRKLLKVLH